MKSFCLLIFVGSFLFTTQGIAQERLRAAQTLHLDTRISYLSTTLGITQDRSQLTHLDVRDRTPIIRSLTDMNSPKPSEASKVFLGSALGLTGGSAAGAGIGYIVYSAADNPDGDMFGGLFTIAAGATVGGAVGSFIGSRWANNYQGNSKLTALGSAVGVVAGIGLGVLAGESTQSTAIGIAVAVPVAISLPAIAEIVSGR